VLRFYKNSLSIVLLTLFAVAFGGHLVTGAHAYSAEQVAHGERGVSPLGYLFRSQFWFESLQNWQSEFLAVGSLVILSVYLRQRGSTESKPVHVAHAKTGAESPVGRGEHVAPWRLAGRSGADFVRCSRGFGAGTGPRTAPPGSIRQGRGGHPPRAQGERPVDPRRGAAAEVHEPAAAALDADLGRFVPGVEHPHRQRTIL